MPATILLVDDSLFGRKTLKRALAEPDYKLIEAANGELALKAVEASQPDLVITDLLMPVMDGLQFLSELRNRGSRVPVVVASADIQKSSRDQCEELGINGFLNKPFSAEELRSLVASILTSLETYVI